MTDDDRILEIFNDAKLRTEGASRDEFVAEACAGDERLKDQVRSLLLAHEGAGEFLKAAPTFSPEIEEELARLKPEEAGERIGRYKLLQEIGEGGFGTVWMAEQMEPVSRRVALKIIKLGMDTKEVIARFEAERQALAMMDHPNIAQVFDAGATQWGRPFFVMELVKGVPITNFCDEQELSTRERLALFGDVCSAINHAHQKGVIHRDIKPSNVMITLHGDQPVVKVIDFGIAKATEGKLTDKTLFTRFEQFIGTPVYMSPEQAATSGLDIDTRSDIYSLGVLLYELLTGRTPIDAETMRQAGLDEMRRMIREVDPPRPSMRVKALDGKELTTTAKRRHTEPAKLPGALRGDLDWIVMKCLEKDRTRRYATANGLALDLQRHLKDEVITARPPTVGYLLGRFIRRNKLAFAAGSAVAAAILIGFTASIWQANVARKEAARATLAEKKTAATLIQVAAERDAKEVARQDAEAISTFLTRVFQSPDPARDGRTITVAESLDNAVRKLDVDLASQPARRAKLQSTLGATYRALGLVRQAIPLEEKARDYYLATFGLEHPGTLSAMNNLAIAYDKAGRREEALKLREEVLPARRRLLGPEHPDTLIAMNNLALSYADAGRRGEALELHEEVLQLRRRIIGPEHPFTLTSMHNLAHSYRDAGRHEEALKLLEAALPVSRKVNGSLHPEALHLMNCLAISYASTGRRDEALKLREETLPLRVKVNGPEHPETLEAMINLAYSYADFGRKDEALKLWQDLLAANLKHDPNSRASAFAYDGLGSILNAQGRSDEAIEAWREALRIDPSLADTSYSLGKALKDQGRYADALPVLRAARKHYPDGNRGWDITRWLALAEFKLKDVNAQPGAPGDDRWKTIPDALRAWVAAHPADSDRGKHLATVHLWLGESREYRALCQKLLALAGASQIATDHDRGAKASLINPNSDPETLKLAVISGRRALELAGPNDGLRPWFLITAAMADFRDEKFAHAELLLNEALQDAKDSADRRGLALAFRAMVRVRLGNAKEARADFDELEKTMVPFPDPPALSAIVSEPDKMAVRLACKEARALLKISPAGKP